MKINTSISNRFDTKNKSITPQKKSLLRQNLSKDSITFGSKDFAERVQEKKKKANLSWIEWNWSGRNKAEEEVKKEMENEIRLGKIKVSGLEETLKSRTTYLEQLKVQNATSLNSKKSTVDANDRALKQKDDTIIYQNKIIESKNQLIKEKEAANKKLENHLLTEKTRIAEHKADVNRLMIKMDEAKIQNNKKLQEALKQQMEKLENAHKLELVEIEKNINKTGRLVKVLENLGNMSKLKGFGKIAGYNEQKEILLDKFASPIALEKTNKTTEVPGGILFFGPHGNGKTTFAEAFAGQLDCDFVKISPTDNFKKLKKTAEAAQKRFKEDKVRTVILINEFDEFAPKNSPITADLKDFMDDCSQTYHCTIFATTNYPERIDDILLREGRFYKAGLPPANKENAAAILKHYAVNFADKEVNYDELAEHIIKVQPDQAFSNARIESLVSTLPQKLKNADKELSHNTLLQAIKKIGPDLDKKALETFKQQIKYVKQL